MVEGRYFFPKSARCVPARAWVNHARVVKIETMDGALLVEAPFRKVKVTPRLADLPRRLMFSDDSCFETPDNDGVDAMIGKLRHLINGGWMDRLERSWRSVLVSVVLAGLAGAAFVVWGLPATALALAHDTPPWLAVMVSDQTMNLLDKRALTPTKLGRAEQAKARALFTRVAATRACGSHDCRLLFRDSAAIGANAFALPDGRIVMTDAMWHVVQNDDEIEAVFAHEMAHVTRAHGLQRVYEAAMVPAAIAVVTGDVSQVSQISVILPGILMQSAYSREFESQADRDAVKTLHAMGARTSAMADLLERLDHKMCGAKGCGASWIGDHPDTAKRALVFRHGG